MNLYSILSNEITTKKIIYAIIIAIHCIFGFVCWSFDSNSYFILPSICIATAFFLAFTIVGNKAKKSNLKFLFYFHGLDIKKKEFLSNFKYVFLITLLINLILLFTSLVVVNIINFDKNYPLLFFLGVLLFYGIFEYYRFTITEIMGLLSLNKTCNNNKLLKEDLMTKIELRYADIDNFTYNINRSCLNECEIYSFCHHQLVISLEKGFVFTPKKVSIPMLKSYLKENDTVIEKLTAEDILILEMLSC